MTLIEEPATVDGTTSTMWTLPIQQPVVQPQIQPALQPNTAPRGPCFPLVRERGGSDLQDRMSISTTGTRASSSCHTWSDVYSDYTFSSRRSSISSMGSSVRGMDQKILLVQPQGKPSRISPLAGSSEDKTKSESQENPVKLPKHNHKAGSWNNVLRVIPCDKDHSDANWSENFQSCASCGFSRCDALMVHACDIPIDTFEAAMNQLEGLYTVDFAGNHPLHFLTSVKNIMFPRLDSQTDLAKILSAKISSAKILFTFSTHKVSKGINSSIS